MKKYEISEYRKKYEKLKKGDKYFSYIKVLSQNKNINVFSFFFEFIFSVNNNF